MSTHNATHTISGKIAGFSDDTDYATLGLASDDQFSGLTDSGGFAAAAAIKVVPAAVPASLTQVLYLSEVAGTAAIDISDIHQGQIGDCFLLSSIGEIARLRPSFISNMIHVNANGTETVTLYVGSNGRLPAYNTTAFRAVSETVSNVFASYSVNNAATQDVIAGQKEIWPQVLEKAVAMLDSGTTAAASLPATYASVMYGGSPLVAMQELTGHATSFYTNMASLSLATLLADQAAGDLLVFDTKASGVLSNGLFNNHAYMFEGVTGTGAAAVVHLGNPWGFDQPTPIAFSTLSKNFAEVDVGHLA